MTNNELLRRLRYTFDYNDTEMMDLLAPENESVSREQLIGWLSKDDEPEFKSLNDMQLAVFLNNLIDKRRGKKEGAKPALETKLNNNIVLRKLKIALDFKNEDILAVLALAESTISKHELSAFFRKRGHKHYRECKDQILRKFLQGLQKKYRSV